VSFVLSLGPSSITLAKSAISKVTVYNVPMRTLIFVFNVNLVSISSTTLVSPVRTTAWSVRTTFAAKPARMDSIFPKELLLVNVPHVMPAAELAKMCTTNAPVARMAPNYPLSINVRGFKKSKLKSNLTLLTKDIWTSAIKYLPNS
jgi:hypothetical protein